MNAVLDHALSYARAGLPVFPVGPDKKPIHKGGFHTASTDAGTIAALFRDHPGAGVAVPMGPPSGLWCLDIDIERVNSATGEVTPSGNETLAALEARYGPLPATLEQRTGGGGRQLLFRWNDERIRNRAGDLGPGLDVRGVKPDGTAGGYIILPPSPHISGGRYAWLTPCDLANAAPAPPWLVFLATFNRHEREALAAIGITGPEGFDDLPASEWPEWAAQLFAEAEAKRAAGAAANGGRSAEGDGGAREHYARAGMEAELDALAATAPGSQDVEMNNAAVRVWSLIKGAGLEGEASTFRSLFLDACRQLPNQAARPRWTEREFAEKWDRARDGARPRDLSHVEEWRSFDRPSSAYTSAGRPSGASGTNGADNRGEPSDASECETWETPDLSLLGSGRRLAPLFPVELLGPFWSGWAARRAAVASAPVDYVAVSLLACMGSMLANVRWPVAGAGWSEPPVLWCGLVGDPGAAKSPGMDQSFNLLNLAEERLALGFDDDLRRHETDKQAAKAKREAWEAEIKAAVKARENPPHLPADAEAPEPPIRPRVRVADATVEALAGLAAGLPRGLLLVRDELAGWFGAFDRYGAGGSDRAFAIEMYGGRSYVVDRVKHAEPRRIRHLSIGVLGGAQPDKLPVIIDGPDDGLCSRLLWAWPDALPAFTLSREACDDRDASVAFARLAEVAMGTDDFGHPEPRRLRLSRQAEDAIEEFARDMARRSEEATGGFASTLGKARGHALRLATVLQFLWWCGTPNAPEPDGISEEAVNAAAALLDVYFIPMAERVFGDAAVPLPERGAMAVARHIRKTSAPDFNARTARREIGGLVRQAAAMEGACKVLVEAGLIRPRFSRTGASKGRQAQTYAVNPLVFRSAR